MRDIGPDDCLKYIAFVKKTVGETWISKEIEKITSYAPPKNLTKLSFIDYANKFHPLAHLIYQVNNQLKSCAERNCFEVTEEILRLSYLGENLFTLRNKEVGGLDDKVMALISSDKSLFDKTTYEIQVAAMYAKNNVPVQFIKTESCKNKRTPDILVANEIEIECKKKDKSSARDIKNIELWKLILRKATGLMEHFSLNFKVLIKTHMDPRSEDIDFILKKIRELIEEKKQGEFTFKENGVAISLYMTSIKDQEIEAHAIHFDTGEEFDYVVPTMEIQQRNDRTIIRNPRLFGFKSSIVPDRISSVLKSIKNATGQLTGNKPGLIYVNLNTATHSIPDDDFRRLDRLIDKILINNSRISAIVITSEYFKNDNNCYIYSHKSKVIRNGHAKNPIPLDFKVVGENLS